MNKENVLWLLAGAKAFQKDSRLDSWNDISRDNFVYLVNSAFQTENLDEAIVVLEKIVADQLTAPSIPPDLQTLISEWEKTEKQRAEIRQTAAKNVESFLAKQRGFSAQKRAVVIPLARRIVPTEGKPPILTPDKERSTAAKRFTEQFIESLRAKAKNIPSGVCQESGAVVAASLLLFPHQEITQEDYQELIAQIEPQIQAQLQEAGVQINKKQIHDLVQEIKDSTYQEANTLVEKTRPLPKVVAQQITTEEGVAFVPLYTILEPTVFGSLLKKMGLAPVVKTLQIADKIAGNDLKGQAVGEWREMLHQGLVAEDITASITAYKEAGLPISHPVIKKLEEKRERLETYQKAHPRITSILKHYHEFAKKTGRRQIYLPQTRTFLPKLSTPPVWSKKKGYSWQLRNSLNRIGATFKTHEKVSLGVGKITIRFSLPDSFVRFTSFGRISSFSVVRKFAGTKLITPVAARLGKTIVGQSVKKLVAGALIKLGLAAFPSGVTQVAAVALLALDILKQLFKNPALLLAVGATLIFLPLLFSFLPLLATAAVIIGAVAFVVGATKAVGAFVGGVASTAASIGAGAAGALGTAIGSLTSALTSAALPAIGVAAIAGIGGTTLVTTLITSSAFVKQPTISVGAPVAYGACSVTSDTTNSQALKDLFVNAGQWAGVPPSVIAAIAHIEGRHFFGYSDEQINNYSASGAEDQINCIKSVDGSNDGHDGNKCTANGPMQFTTFEGKTKTCGDVFDVWSSYKIAVNRALPNENRNPNVCNIKDSIYAAALKIKTDSGMSSGENCTWDEATVKKAAERYFGVGGCDNPLDSLGGKTYCQYVWDYYQVHTSTEVPNPSGWFYYQADARWGNYSAGLPASCRIGNTGCGPTSMAMIFSRFGSITLPSQMWDRFIRGGYLTCEGSSWQAIYDVPTDIGLTVQDLGQDWDLAAQKLAEGKLIFASTTLPNIGGHMLVIRGIVGDNLITNDPQYANGDGFPYTRGYLSPPTLKNLWAIGR